MTGASWAVFASLLCIIDCVFVNFTDPTPPQRPVRHDRCLNRGPKSNMSIVCFLTRWDADAGPLAEFDRGNIVQLRVKIWDESTRLTAAHLRGMRRLRTLSVVGTCHDTVSFLSAGYCDDSRGLDGIEPFAFIHTPRLEALFLVTHPLTHLQHFNGLVNLRRLTVQWTNRLEYVLPSALDPLRAKLENLLMIDNKVSVLAAWMFVNMSRLETVRWFAPFEMVEAHTFSRLPRLRSIALNVRSNFMTSASTLHVEPYALEHLPSLRELHLRNIDRRVGGQNSEPFCNLTNSNMETLRANFAHLNVLRLCSGLFNCPACGADPGRRPQRVLLRRIYSSEADRTLATILPPGNFSLNISELQVLGSSVNAIGNELARMPLLRRLFIHKISNTNLKHTSAFFMGNIVRLTENPLKFHPFPARLTEVRLLLNFCNCVVLDMIRWFARNTAPGARLLVGCENLKCNACGMMENKYSEPWQDLRVLATVLDLACVAEPSPNATLSEARMCAAKCAEVKGGGRSGPEDFARPLEAGRWLVGVAVGTALAMWRPLGV